MIASYERYENMLTRYAIFQGFSFMSFSSSLYREMQTSTIMIRNFAHFFAFIFAPLVISLLGVREIENLETMSLFKDYVKAEMFKGESITSFVFGFGVFLLIMQFVFLIYSSYSRLQLGLEIVEDNNYRKEHRSREFNNIWLRRWR